MKTLLKFSLLSFAVGLALASDVRKPVSESDVSTALACPGTAASTTTTQVCAQATITACPAAGTPLTVRWTPYVTSGATTSLAAGGCTLPVTTNEGSTV